jgi:metal-responsive CopG/Arc/MetJ family transcriptional regulator
MTEIITFSISKHLLKKMDKTRGDIPRSKYITRMLENAMLQEERKNYEQQC